MTGDDDQRLCLIKFMNSSRVLACWKKPVKSEVVVKEFCFSTPRICMHICCASITTITPNGSKVLWIQSLICIVIRSCIWRRRAKISTTLGSCLSRNIFLGDISHVGLAEERQHMMLTKGEEIDISHDNHLFVILFLKHGGTEHRLRVLMISLG